VAEIIWHNEKRAIRELIPYEANPRQITDKQAKDLKASLAKFGIADPIIINTDNMIIGGHQRKKILETLLGYDPDFQIDVRVPDRELSIDEARELNVRLNKNTGSWDFDVLANEFELPDLIEWGFTEYELLHTSFDGSTLFDSFNDAVNSNSEFERVSLITDHNTANLIKAEIKKTSMDEFCLRVAEMLNA